MQKLNLIAISALFLASSALADNAVKQHQPTLAALEAKQQIEWQLPEKAYRFESRQNDQLSPDTKKLNAQIESELDARLQDKLNQQLQLDL